MVRFSSKYLHDGKRCYTGWFHWLVSYLWGQMYRSPDLISYQKPSDSLLFMANGSLSLLLNSRLFGSLSSSVLTPVKPLDDPSVSLNDRHAGGKLLGQLLLKQPVSRVPGELAGLGAAAAVPAHAAEGQWQCVYGAGAGEEVLSTQTLYHVPVQPAEVKEMLLLG